MRSRALPFLDNAARVLRVMLAGCLVCAFSGGTSTANPPISVPTRVHSTPMPNPRIKIIIEHRGTIVAELYPTRTPKTVAHILALVRRKFYDHLLFHSVVKGFMATTGDPKSRSIDGAKIAKLSDLEVTQKYHLGGGGSGNTVPLEPGLSHVKGSLGLQHGLSSIDSGDSQFFFNLANNATNDSAYCAFGRVISGMDVMEKIAQGDRIDSIRVMPAQKPAYLGPSPK